MELELVVDSQEERTVVHVAGELDAFTGTQLRQCLLAVTSEGPLRVVVDLSRLSFVDSTGLGVLIGALKRQRTRGGTFAVIGAAGSVRKVLDITGLTATFDSL